MIWSLWAGKEDRKGRYQKRTSVRATKRGERKYEERRVKGLQVE